MLRFSPAHLQADKHETQYELANLPSRWPEGRGDIMGDDR